MLDYKDIITKHYALGMKGGEIAATLGGYTGALKAPVRCFGNHLSRKRKSLFRTDDECGGAAILKIRISRMGRQLMGYYYSLNAGSSPYTSLMER